MTVNDVDETRATLPRTRWDEGRDLCERNWTLHKSVTSLPTTLIRSRKRETIVGYQMISNDVTNEKFVHGVSSRERGRRDEGRRG